MNVFISREFKVVEIMVWRVKGEISPNDIDNRARISGGWGGVSEGRKGKE